MKVIRYTFIAHVLAAVTALSVGFTHPLSLPDELAFLNLQFSPLLFLSLGGVWLAANLRRPGWLTSLFLLLFILSAALGVLLNAPGWLMLIVSSAALAAWDLDHFFGRLSAAEQVENEDRLWRVHVRRLVLVEGLGLLAGLMAVMISVQIPFWWEALLALAAVIGIRLVIESLRREVE